jgi:hypothetical protein
MLCSCPCNTAVIPSTQNVNLNVPTVVLQMQPATGTPVGAGASGNVVKTSDMQPVEKGSAFVVSA